MWCLFAVLVVTLCWHAYRAKPSSEISNGESITSWHRLNYFMVLLPWFWATSALSFGILAIVQDNLGILDQSVPSNLLLAILFGSIGWGGRLFNKLNRSFGRPYQVAIPSSDPSANTYPLSVAERIILVFIGLMVVLTFAAGCLLPPNNWDSLTYHLSRMMFWYQHNSLEFYPTANTRQLYQPPFAELVGYIGWLVDGKSDRGLFLIQWLSYVSSLSLVWQLLRQNGLSRLARLVAIGVMASTPMFILQASSTQNDLLLGFLLLLMLTALLKASPYGWGWLLLAGLMAVLAIMTKGTALIYVPSLLTGWFVYNWRQIRWASLVPIKISVLALLTLLYGQQLYRNYQFTGHVLGVDAAEQLMYANQTHSAGPMVNNLLRNITMHLGVIGFDNVMSKALTLGIGTLTNTDVNDPSITFQKQTFATQGSTHEDTASNLIGLVFIIVGGITAIWQRKNLRSLVDLRLSGSIWLGGVLSLLLFCYVFKWQPWHSRLHLPFFMLMVPLSTAITVQYIDRRKVVWQVFLCLSVGIGLWFVLKNDRRQLGNPKHWQATGIEAYYAANNEGMAPEVANLTQYLKANRINHVGLFMEGDAWDYPFLQFGIEHEIMMTNVATGNATKSLRQGSDQIPQYIILDLCRQWDTITVRPFKVLDGQHFWLIKDTPDRKAMVLLDREENKRRTKDELIP